MIGVEEGGADFAIADLSVTSERNEAVQFSNPWMTLGISIIFVKPRQAPPSLLSFLSPFTLEVWIYIALGKIKDNGPFCIFPYKMAIPLTT